MSLTAGIIRTLLVAAIVCFWTTHAKAQTAENSGRSTVRGTAVYSDTGRPLRHALVILYAEDRGWQGNTATDLRGQFVFTNVPAGKYILTLEAPGLIIPVANFPPSGGIVPDPVYPEKSEFVTEVIVNGTDSVELKVKAVRGGVITGRVVTDDDQPLVNAQISLLRRENGKWVPVWTTWFSESQAQQRTDASGVYRIAGLRSGEYLVRASEPFLPDDPIPGAEDAYSNGSFMVAYHPAATALKDAQAVSVVAGKESTGIDIHLPQREPHTLMGMVKSPIQQMAGGSVEITVERFDEIGFAEALRDITTRAGKDGKWRIDGLPAGQYRVTFTGGAVKVDADEGVDFVQALRKRIRVRIPDERKVTVLNTTLTLGAQVYGTVTLNGRPVDNDFSLRPAVEPVDKPVSSTGAAEERGDLNATGDSNKLSLHSGLVRSQGKFSITALTPGAYWFRFDKHEDAEFYVKSVTRKGVDLMQTPIKLAEDEVFDDVVVSLSTNLSQIEGQVILPDGAAKALLDDLKVIMAPANEATNRLNAGTRTMQAEAGGKIVLKSGPGEYFIAAITTAEYKKIQSDINNRWFEKNAHKFLRLKVRAGEKIKGVAVPMMNK